ncbi:TlpA disulfide reductase family protein [Flaviaesturariibacter amylovorans]|uniref:Thioredoxin domain-containing protein n=1 Tax=Flaviaesturariibacter amylovorans TaxID=1084520 RepID=A0ABP8HVD5_9BACT
MRSNLLLLLLCLLTLQLSAQPRTVTIRGIVQDPTLDSIVLIHPGDAALSKWEHTTLPVVNGAFATSIPIPFPSELSIRQRNRVYGKLFVSGDAVIRIDSARAPQLTGSPEQDEYEKAFLPFFATSDRFRDSMSEVFTGHYRKWGSDFPKAVQDSLTLLLQQFYTDKAALLAEYIRQHPDSYVALWNIDHLILNTPAHQYADLGKLLSLFSPALQQGSFLPVLRERLKGAARMQTGQPFPEDFFKGQEAVQRKLAKENKYYLVDFWHSRCAPCLREFPNLKALHSRFRGKGFDIVSISVDKQQDEGLYAATVRKHALPWNQVWDRNGANADRYNIHAFPTYVLVDKSGKIINPDIRPAQLETFLQEHL